MDGLRFVVPKRTINAGPSPKYYHFKRGITRLNAVNDQVAGIGQMVVPGTPRDSLHILDTLLNLDAGMKPEMVATDNASYSDIVFGLFSMLGYNFSPRFKAARSARTTCCGCSAGKDVPPRWGRHSRSTGGSARPCTYCVWSIRSTTPTGGR